MSITLATPRRRRPFRADVRSTARIEFVVTEDEKRALIEMARENRQTLASAIRDSINTYVAEYRERVIFTPSGDKFPHQK